MAGVPGPVGRHSEENGDVVTAVDATGGREELVIADITRDGAWLAMATEHAASIEE